MEDALVQSAMAEIAMWDAFAAGRTANATGFLAIVLAVWVAARFSSVSLEKNVNMLGKVFVTAFAVGVFLSGLVVVWKYRWSYMKVMHCISWFRCSKWRYRSRSRLTSIYIDMAQKAVI